MAESLLTRAEPAASHALAAAALACLRALDSQSLARDTLRALHSAGLISAGEVRFAFDPTVQVNGPTALRLPGRCEEPIPTRAAPPASLIVWMKDQACPGDIVTVAALMGASLDRLALEARVAELRPHAERRLDEVSTLYEIGRAIDQVDIGRLLEIITEKAATVMNAQACSLMRLNPETNALTIAASHGLSEDVVFVTQVALGEGIAGRVAQTGEPLLLAGEERDPMLSGLALRPDIGSSILVPMRDEGGGVIGVLSIRRRRPAPDFTEDDLRLFSIFASQAALAINNVQLYSDLRRHAGELSTLAELTQRMIATLDLQSLADEITHAVSGALGFERCCLFLCDRAVKRLRPASIDGYDATSPAMRPWPLGEGVVGQVAAAQQPLFELDAGNAEQPSRGFGRALGAPAYVALPVVSKGETIGVIVADNGWSSRPISGDDVRLLTTFVAQAALAIENAQLYEDREQRYQEMNRLATQTDNILRSIAASVVVVDTEGRVTRWNQASEEMWGIAEQAATRASYAQLIERFGLPDDEAERLLRTMEEVRSTGKPHQDYKLTLHPRRRQEVTVNLLVAPLIDREGVRQGVVQTMEDVTREQRMEAEIGRIRRLADIGQLAAKMAHEVRNPLSSIKGAAQLMRNEYADQAPLREFLDIIVDEVNALSRITTDLLDFARPMQLDLHWLSLNDIAERTLQFLAGDLRQQGVQIKFKPQAGAPMVQADPKQIEQVMRNVVINALQAMPGGGELIVSTAHEATRNRVTVRFADSGLGIPEEKLEEIFQPFVTTKTKGTGLGLPIVRKIVENHGGEIRVSSRPGAGAIFAISFPIRPAVSTLPTRTLADRPEAPVPDV